MYIDEPLLTLDIIPEDDQNQDGEQIAVLRANQTKFLMRSTLTECLNEREEMLTVRKFKVPEDWELSWSFNQGISWTPRDFNSTTLWVQPGFITPNLAGTRANGWTDALDLNANPPYELLFVSSLNLMLIHNETSGVSKGFEGVVADGANRRLRAPIHSGDRLGMTSTDSDDVSCFVIFNSQDVSANAAGDGSTIVCQDDQGDDAAFDISITDGGFVRVEYQDVAITSNDAIPDNAVVMVSFIKSGVNGVLYVRTDGGLYDVQLTTGLSGKSVTSAKRFTVGDRGAGVSPSIIHEIIVFNSQVSGATDSPNINNAKFYEPEGYLAHKYGVLFNPTSDVNHPYRTSPPKSSSV